MSYLLYFLTFCIFNLYRTFLKTTFSERKLPNKRLLLLLLLLLLFELHNIRFKWMVCDGDSKAFNTVEDTYPDCKVIKLDYVGNVQKRMGKHLLNLKSRTKGKLADGKPIGGRGRLTDDKIKQI